uniref:Trace amine-associated receptor 4-like n=1 Tax=Petromyzon marinus TaxID=7757 RepID=A0AAJ7UCZ8_PETMA|nr:trace amine-associated receptor 4-like [Petromyzon marinus]
MPFSAARTAYNCWFYGDLFCHLHTWLDFSTCTSSIANLACISLERYASIAEPLRYRQMVTPRVLAAMLLLSWSGLPLYGATFMLGWNLVGIKRQVAESSCRHDCRVYMNPASTATNVLVAYVTPMLLMIMANAKIHRLARAQVRRIEGSAMVSGRDDRASTKREHNATQTLGIITGTFILLWMPYFILVASEPLLGYGTSRAAWEVVCWLPYLNSAVNPVLLMVFNRSFNGAFRLVLKGGVLKSSFYFYKMDVSKELLYTGGSGVIQSTWMNKAARHALVAERMQGLIQGSGIVLTIVPESDHISMWFAKRLPRTRRSKSAISGGDTGDRNDGERRSQRTNGTDRSSDNSGPHQV